MTSRSNETVSKRCQSSNRAKLGGRCRLPRGSTLKEVKNHCRALSRAVTLPVFRVQRMALPAQLRTHCREAGVDGNITVIKVRNDVAVTKVTARELARSGQIAD